MRNRIISIWLCLMIVVMTMPFGMLSAVAETEGEEFALKNLDLPQTVIDKTVQTFTGLDSTAIGDNGNGGYAAYVTKDSGLTVTPTIENDELKLTYDVVASGKYANVHIWMDTNKNQNPSSASTMVSIHIDATGVEGKAEGGYIPVRAVLGYSYGSTGFYSNYAQANKTYYFMPDATEENPNPVMQTLTTPNVTVIDNVSVSVFAGKSGTYYFPVDMFRGTIGENWIKFDVDTMLSNTATWRHNNCLRLELRDSSIAAGSVLKFDDIYWHRESPVAVYKTAYSAEDFSSFDISTELGKWSTKMTVSHSISEDGRLKIYTEDSTDYGTYNAIQVKNLGRWNKNTKAFAFDLDASEITGHNLRFALRLYEDGESATTTFSPYNGKLYMLYDNGTLNEVALGTKDGRYGVETSIPEGFKGKIIIPAEYFRKTDDKTVFSDEIYEQENLLAEIEIKGYGVSTNYDIDVGKSIYFDNFDFYVEPLSPTSGTTFSATQNSNMQLGSIISEDVGTVEFWVKTTASSAGTILSKKYNSANAAKNNVMFFVGMNSAGNIEYKLADGNGNYQNYVFSGTTVNNGEWTHVALVKDNGTVKYYVNGAFIEEKTDVPTVSLGARLLIGHTLDRRVIGADNYFDGEIAELRLWNDARTQSELYFNATGAPVDTTGLIAGYALSADLKDTYVGNGDIEKYDYMITAEDEEYSALDAGASDEDGEYSIVFVPDIQTVNCLYPDNLHDINDWIIENKDKYNIEAVMGLGDITEFNDDDETAAYYGEWMRAKEESDRLTAAGIPWTVIPGNHDLANQRVDIRDYTKMNETYTYEEISNFSYFGGSYADNGIVNSYYYLNVGSVKYLLLCLDNEPRSYAMNWASQIIAAHPDHRVIVTTHAYMNDSGVRFTMADGNNSNYTGWGTGEQIWEQVLAPYENVDMIVCGHIDAPNIVTRTDKGVNGNDILQVLVDTQYVDETFDSLAAVAVATFSADGNNVRFRLYSTTKKCFLDEDSQFSTALSAKTGAEVVNDNAADVFNNPLVVRDFTTLDLSPSTSSGGTSSQFAIGKDVSGTSEVLTLENATLENRKLKLTPNLEDSATRMDFSFRSLPNITESVYNAIAIQFDASSYNPSKGTYFRFGINGNDFTYSETTEGSVVYLLSDDGSFIKTTQGNWATSLPKSFKGYIIIPLDNIFSTGTKTADYFVQSVGNSMVLTMFLMENVGNYNFYFDNLCYLKNFDPDFIGTEESTKPTNNVVLTDEITVNYKLDADTFTDAGYTNPKPRAEFEVNGVVTNVTDYTVEDGKYVFAFTGVNPKNIADNITVTYFATDDSGVEYSAYKQNYSVKEYCDSILANYTGDDAEEVMSVIKGMLNFSAASQEYFSYNTDSLANAGLDEADKELTFTDEEKPVDKMAIKANENGESTVKWKSAGLNFSSNVALRFNIEAADINGLVVKAVVGEDTWFIPATAFSKVDGTDNRYYVYFNKLSVACMRDTVDFTVYDANGAQVSDTLTYSIESYAAAKFENTGAIGRLVKSMIKYGDAAKALNAAAAQ